MSSSHAVPAADQSPGGAWRRHEQHRAPVTTIIDVARAAGASTATVSGVFNNHPQVDLRLAATVQQAVKDLGCRPSRVARSLRTRRNRVWALIISDVRTGPFFGDLVRGVEDVAYEAGYSLFLCNADEDLGKEASYIELAVAENVGGVILTPSGPRTDLSLLANFGIPVVLADRTLAMQQADSFLVDNVAGACEAVTHLLASGSRASPGRSRLRPVISAMSGIAKPSRRLA